MRIVTWLVFMPALALLAAGCKFDDHTQPKNKPQAKAAEGDNKQVAQNPPVPPPQPSPPPKNDGGVQFAKKGGGSIVTNVRGQGWRIQRRQELKQIGTIYIDFCDTNKGPNRTLANFLKTIERERAIHDAIKEGYYEVNLKADPTSGQSILAYERDIDGGRHLCVMGDTSVDYVPLQEFNAALGK